MSRRIYKPMLARTTEKPFSDENWIFEIKWDGFRAIAYLDKFYSLKSRNGKELKQNFPELEEINKLNNNIVVDGEIVVMSEGTPDFQTLLQRGQAVAEGDIQRQVKRAPAIYIVFDILEKDGTPITKLPLIERKKFLANSLKEGSNVILSDFIEEKGIAYYQSALDKGLEGVIAKKKNSHYEEGSRSGSWLKIKKLKTCDCIIFGYTKGSQSRGSTFGALLLGVYDKEGKPVYIGKVGTGFTQEMLEILKDKFDKLQIKDAPFKSEAGDIVTWLEPKLVCEVVYQVVTRDMKLRMARFQRLREDKPPKQCTLNQLIEVKKIGSSVNTLSEYKSKRNFEITNEPKGGEKKHDKLIFVIQEHHARRLHYDLRLESGGALRSWAIPKGIPENSGERRLAVETEDHPIEYANFEGEIPKGQYGAGIVKIWDKGQYEPKLWEPDKIEFNLNGERLKARYILVRLKKAEDAKNWLLIKGKEILE